ncbi:MAG: L-aspartate oxidase [Deltaproteobacteria bacterium]|nr:L-aspartate oxidase [Deltaproteobacteria bacterium]
MIGTGRSEPGIRVDTLVIGGGVAGFRAAIEAVGGGSVLVVTKDVVRESNTAYAQGGVAAVLGDDDSIEAHCVDTFSAGQGLSERDAVEVLVGEGPAAVRELQEWGGTFDEEDGELHLTREGGHSFHRVAHAHGDATGREFVKTLLRAVRAHADVTVWEFTFAVDFIVEDGRCVGCVVFKDGAPVTVAARNTILCTGGAGQVFRETTNPPVATGDGHAMALRAGVLVGDMEFVQFHPTTLYVAGAARHLITEAVRGEGGRLVDTKGDRFVFRYHPDGEMAPRDVVSRATVQHLAMTGEACVYLDVRHLGVGVRDRFPGLEHTCSLYRLDITTDLIPVHPSAHYVIGGCRTDLQGRTSLPGLFAAGEASLSGVHGANRLASNSLLEGLVFGRRAGACAIEDGGSLIEAFDAELTRRPGESDRPLPATVLNVADMKNSIQSLMWRQAGIIRSEEGLRRAYGQMQTWEAYVQHVRFEAPDALEMQNMLAVALAIVRGALWRKESRGTHYRTDHPERDDRNFRQHAMQPGGEEILGSPLE